jgi:hypothetical protein
LALKEEQYPAVDERCRADSSYWRISKGRRITMRSMTKKIMRGRRKRKKKKKKETIVVNRSLLDLFGIVVEV